MGGYLPGSTWWSGASWWLLLMEKPAGGRFTPKAVRYFLITVHEGLTGWSGSEWELIPVEQGQQTGVFLLVFPRGDYGPSAGNYFLVNLTNSGVIFDLCCLTHPIPSISYHPIQSVNDFYPHYVQSTI